MKYGKMKGNKGMKGGIANQDEMPKVPEIANKDTMHKYSGEVSFKMPDKI